MEYFCEVINSADGKKGKSKPPLEEYIRMSRSKMQKDATFLLRTQFFLHLELFALRNVRHYSRHVRLLELSNSLTALAAEAFIISCNDCNALTRIRNKIYRNSGPQRKLGFLDFPPITEIDGVNFGSHNIQDLWKLDSYIISGSLTPALLMYYLNLEPLWKWELIIG
ncbi:hypothetical protein F2Q69_00012426 [Brassica cretica]|uniref:Uncharacterized protein n=1 Tax=Brassica cretica TaxID=69181 RepID=A0A8S9QT16_BRACR|nr:hypothetical protein F2Q69_00012426 [Brassica cretica]